MANQKSIVKLSLCFLLSACAILTGCGKKQISSESEYYDILKSEPAQEKLDNEKHFNADNGFTITAKYDYRISARVLGKEEYSWDKESHLAPFDLILGWNKMSDRKLLDKSRISFSQGRRFYFWRAPSFDTLSRKEIEENSANVHIIPANSKIKDYIDEKVKENDIIYMEGYLVNIKQEKDSNTFFWNTSTTRTDTGAGACEIFFVNKVIHLIEKDD